MPTNAQKAKIHIAKKEIGLSDQVYRDLLLDRYGVESSKYLKDGDVRDLLDHFRALGWRPRKGRGTPGRKKRDGNYIEIKPGPAARQQRKVLALWNELGYGMAKLHVRCRKQFGVERFEWLTDYRQLHVLITDLDARLKAGRHNDTRGGF